MKRLIKEGIITTSLGLAIIIFTGAMIWKGQTTAESMSGWLALGIMFLRSKDSLIGITKDDESL